MKYNKISAYQDLYIITIKQDKSQHLLNQVNIGVHNLILVSILQNVMSDHWE